MKRHSIARRLRAGWLGLGLGLVAGLLLANSARADVKVPSIFSSHMVLQQNQKNKVWGKAEPGEKVTVTIGGMAARPAKTTTADGAGNWSVLLDPMPANEHPSTLTIAGENTITLTDVLVGEVWVCSGQSNMQWDVAVANDPDLELLSAKDPLIRLITVPQVGTQDPKDDFKGRWYVCTPDSARHFSAVGYFFGRQLRQVLGVPIGLIDDSWGGSACEAWIRRDLLEKDAKYRPLIERWEAIERDAPEAAAKYAKELAKWKEAQAKPKSPGDKTPEEKAPVKPPDMSGQLNGNARPGNIYNGVLKPTIGYGIKGVIWYQGESNASRAYQYRDLFPLMIQSWRDEWKIGDFSFYWVQLADFYPEKAEPGDSAWAELREAQTLTMSKLPNTGQAVIIDIGEAQDIHPRNKLDVAKRLARWALARDYGIKIAYQSPVYKSMEKKDNKITVTLGEVGSGLKAFDVPEVRGFTIAGDDKVFHKAKAKILGGGKVEVWADDVAKPVAVRYAWADNPVCNLYGNGGLPVTPFRTDDWKGVTADAK